MWKCSESGGAGLLRAFAVFGVLATLALLAAGCGRAESCTVEELEDGAVRITCDDGTEAVLRAPEFEGLPEPCTAEESGDGDVTIRCPGSDPVTLAGGIGDTGPTGPPGTNCTVEETSGGEVRVVCGDASVVIPVADGASCAIETAPDADTGGESTLLVCGEDEVVLATCGNGRVELDQECDLGSANGAACTLGPGAFRCEGCSASCRIEEREIDRATITGLLLHANEGALGAVPGARIEASGGYATWTDDFGAWTLEVPAGEPTMLHVHSADVSRVDIDPDGSFNSRVPLRTAPTWHAVEALEADSTLAIDLHVLSGHERLHTMFNPFLDLRALPRFVDFSSPGSGGAPTVSTISAISVNATVIRDANGAQIPRNADVDVLIAPIGQPPHSADLLEGDGDGIAWGGVHRLGLPARATEGSGLEGRRVLGGMYVGLWYEGEPLSLVEGLSLTVPVGGNQFMDFPAQIRVAVDLELLGDLTEENVEALYFDVESGTWQPGGVVRDGFVFDPQGDGVVDAFTTPIDRLGWWVIVERAPAATGCVQGTLTWRGEPVGGTVSLWTDSSATVAQAASDGSFCTSIPVGEASVLSTALPADWDRHVAQAQVEVSDEGSCAAPSACVDIGTLSLEALFGACASVSLVGGSGEGMSDAFFPLPVSVRHELESPPRLRRDYLAEDQWLVGRQSPLGGSRVCAPLRTTAVEQPPEALISNDLDVWCPEWSWVFSFDTPDEGVCTDGCADDAGATSAEALLYCDGELG